MNPFKLSLWNILDGFTAAEKVLNVTSSGMLTVAGIQGYSVYISFMEENPNTKKRLINVLNGQFAMVEQLTALGNFVYVIGQVAGYEEESVFNSAMLLARVFLGLTSGIIQLLIGTSTCLKKFYPDDYLDQSDKWTIKKSLVDLLILMVFYGLMVGFCALMSTDLKSFKRMIAAVFGAVLLVIFCLTFLLQMCIVIEENKKKVQFKMNKLFKSNTVSPAPETEENEEEYLILSCYRV